MNTENSAPKEEKDLFDVMVIVCRWFKDLFRAVGRFCVKALSLMLKHWAVVLTSAVLLLAFALFLNRPSNRRYKVQAVAMLQVMDSDRELVKQVYNQLGEAWNVPDTLLPNSLSHILNIPVDEALALRKFKAYDMLENKLGASWVDTEGYARNVSDEDSTTTLQQRRLAFTFETKRPEHVAMIEEAVLNYLNSNPQLQVKHQVYRNQLDEQYAFQVQQIALLDSVSRAFYASQVKSNTSSVNQLGTNIVVGRQELAFNNAQINSVYYHKGGLESAMALCTAPVVLENGFVVSALPMRHPIFFPVKMLLLGLLIGLLIAFVVDNFKAWIAVLKA